jgi:hypothetical protein
MKLARTPIKPPDGGMLTHFTRASHPAAALDNLAAILGAGMIRASIRMIRTKRPVICFFDAPFEYLARVLDPRARRRYEPFGIAVSKRYAFKMGARPVDFSAHEKANDPGGASRSDLRSCPTPTLARISHTGLVFGRR